MIRKKYLEVVFGPVSDAQLIIAPPFYIHKLIPQHIWFKESKELQVNDVIYFKKVANDLSSAWTIGQVEAVIRSQKVIRKVTIRYTNIGEDRFKTTDNLPPNVKCSESVSE